MGVDEVVLLGFFRRGIRRRRVSRAMPQSCPSIDPQGIERYSLDSVSGVSVPFIPRTVDEDEVVRVTL